MAEGMNVSSSNRSNEPDATFRRARSSLIWATKYNQYHLKAWIARGKVSESLNLSAEASYCKGRAYLIMEKNEDALAWYYRGEALDKLGRIPEANYNKGEYCNLIAEDEKVLLYFTRAKDQNSSYADAWLKRGGTLEKLGRFSEAEYSKGRGKIVALILGHPC